MMLGQRNQKQINNSIDKWIDIHFGDTSFHGNVVLGQRKPNEPGVYNMSFRPISKIRPYVKKVLASPRRDYYITANTVTGVKRRKENLFGLQNIVIDIDCHDDRPVGLIQTLLEAFILRSERDLWGTGVIPTPNSIVRTGRGVQLWWAIVPVYGGKGYDTSRYYHDKIKKNMIDHFVALLNEYPEELEGLNVDSGASGNPVGYFRLPHTYNTKAGCYGSLDILHSERYDQRKLALLEAPEITETHSEASEDSTIIPMLETDRELLRGFHTTGVRRVMQLINLRNLRNNEVGSEMRDYFNFFVYNTLRMAFDHADAMERVRVFNAGFKQPMTERELANCISSAKAKGGYKCSNTRIITKLKITPEEQQAIGLFPFRGGQASKPNASRDAARKALKEDRDYKILELIEQGVSQAETARRLGIGKNTVGRVLKRLRDEASTVEAAPKDEGEDRHQNGSIYVTESIDSISNNMYNYASVLPYSRPASHRENEKSWVGGLFGMPKTDSS